MKKKQMVPFVLAAMLLTACGGGQQSSSQAASSMPSATSEHSEPSAPSSEPSSTPSSEPSATSSEEPSSTPPSESSAEKVFVVVNVVSGAADIDLSKDKGKAVPGETIALTITPKNGGMLLDAVSAKDSQGNDVSLTLEEGKYTYALPSDGSIDLSVSVKGKPVAGTIQDAKSLVDSISMRKHGASEFEEIKESEGTYALYYGARVRIALKANGYYEPTGIKIGDTSYLLNDGVAEFLVNPEVGESMSISVAVTYKDNTPKVGEYTFAINQPEHLEISLLSETGAPVTSADQSDTVYVKITAADPDYHLRELSVYGITDATTGSKGFAEAKYNEELDLYSFKTPFSATKVITITATESYDGTLRGTGLPGTYLTVSLMGGNTLHTAWRDNKFVINGSGESSYTNENYPTVINSYDPDTHQVHTANNSTLYWGNNILLADEYSSSWNPLLSAFGNCDVIYVKMENKDDDPSLYSLREEQFKIGDDFYVLCSVTKDDKQYASCFIDFSKKTIDFGVEFNILSGGLLGENQEVVEIIDEKGEKRAIGYQSDGTLGDRVLCGEYYGTYSDGENSLYLTGGPRCTYNKEEYDVAIEGNRATIENPSRTVVLDLNNETRALVVVSSKEKEAVSVSFSGQRYVGKYYDDWDERNNDIKLVFDDSEEISGIMYLAYGTNYPFPFTGKVENGILVLEFVQYSTGGTKIVDSGKIGAVVNWEIGENSLKFLSATKFGKTDTYSLMNASNTGMTLTKQ